MSDVAKAKDGGNSKDGGSPKDGGNIKDSVNNKVGSKEADAKHVSVTNKNAVRVNDVIRIEYGARTIVERWFDEYWTERERALVPWLFVVLLLGFIVVGPQWLLWLAGLLPVDQLGNSGASIAAHHFLQLLAAIFAASALGVIGIAVTKPALLEISAQGLRRIWMLAGLVPVKGKILPWSLVSNMHILRESGCTDPRDYQIAIATETNPAVMKLALRNLEGDASKELMVDAISKHASKVRIEQDVFDALTPQRGLSFTEVWLDALSAPPKREQLLPLAQGALLDSRYRVLKKLGAGGQGSVYLAEDSQTSQNVVLKETILPVYADLIARKKALEVFHQEAFALESVKHPDIVKFLGSFVADHRAYLVLAFIDGTTISETVSTHGPLREESTTQLAIQMCDVLSQLHSLSPPLVHRDFTPDNLMIKADGRLMLFDFAVAVSGDGDSEDVAGKICYMAPEQLKGRPTTQSDIYSLGCTLYYMLTGHHPEPITEQFPIVDNDQVSESMNNLVRRCTKLSLNERYKSVSELKSDLEKLDV